MVTEKDCWNWRSIKFSGLKNPVYLFFDMPCGTCRRARADTTKTLYVHDASGNIMAIYTLRNNDTLKLNDVPIYGSSRLGVWNANKILHIDSVLHDTEIQAQDPQDPATEGVTYIAAGEKQYSLSNHLDNVLATVSDRKIPVYASGVLDHYEAEQITGNDYFAFGSPLPQRQFSIGGFRWSFNGKEFDIEINGRRNHYDYGFRIVNTDLGKFLSVDPLTGSYPMCLLHNSKVINKTYR